MKSTVSERGQITIPKAIRNDLGIKAGMVIDFIVDDGKIIGVKKESEDPFRKWRGRGKLPEGFASVDDYLAKVRE